MQPDTHSHRLSQCQGAADKRQAVPIGFGLPLVTWLLDYTAAAAAAEFASHCSLQLCCSAGNGAEYAEHGGLLALQAVAAGHMLAFAAPQPDHSADR